MQQSHICSLPFSLKWVISSCEKKNTLVSTLGFHCKMHNFLYNPMSWQVSPTKSTANVITVFDFACFISCISLLLSWNIYSSLPRWALIQLLYCKAPGEQHIGQMAPYLHYSSWRTALLPVRGGDTNNLYQAVLREQDSEINSFTQSEMTITSPFWAAFQRWIINLKKTKTNHQSSCMSSCRYDWYCTCMTVTRF